MNRLDNYKLFYDTIKALSFTQGGYGRLLKEIDSLDDWNKQELIDQLPDFKDTVDIIATVKNEYRNDYGGYGPVLYAESLEKTIPMKDPLVKIFG